MAKSRPAPVTVSPAVPLVSATRVGVDESLTGKDRRRAEKAATRQLKPRKLRALADQLDAAAADAANLGLLVEVDHDALVALAAERVPDVTAAPTPPAAAPAPSAAAQARRTPSTRHPTLVSPGPLPSGQSSDRTAVAVATPEPGTGVAAPRRRAPATRTATRTPARRTGGSSPA